MKKLFTSIAMSFLLLSSAYASCANPPPRAQPFVAPSGQGCPSGYSSSGSTCSPSSSSAKYVFIVPSGQGCPSGYSSQGRMCVVSSSTACYAFVGGGSCPSGYSSQGPICISRWSSQKFLHKARTHSSAENLQKLSAVLAIAIWYRYRKFLNRSWCTC